MLQGQPELQQHLNNIFAKLMLDNQQNAYDEFEKYSNDVKFHNFNYEQQDDYVDNYKRNNFANENILEQQSKIQQKLLLSQKQEEDQTVLGQVQHFIEDSSLLEQLGIGFGSEEAQLIQYALVYLAKLKQCTSVRFFGKILCSGNDYYIAEAVTSNFDEQNIAETTDKKNEDGINKLIYYASTDLMGKWTELPAVTAQQIITSRKLRYIFTGDLEADVIMNPQFLGKEKHLLKCQITRIQHQAQITMKTTLTEDETILYPTFQEIQKLSGWMHSSESILQEGRLVHLMSEPPGDMEPEDWKKVYESKDPTEPKNKLLSDDKSLKNSSNYVIQTLGDSKEYTIPQWQNRGDADAPIEEKFINYGIISIRNLTWNGYVTAYQNQRSCSVYVGYGLKNSESLYFPKCPLIVNDQQPCRLGYQEPNFPADLEDE